MKLLAFTGFILLICVYHVKAQQKFTDYLRQKIDGPAKVADKVQLLFTPDLYSAVSFPLKELPDVLSHSGFKKSLPTVFYFHGWMENGTQEASVVTVRGAYMDRGDHNVLTVDWSYYGKNLNYHLDVIPQMKVIGETFAEKLRDFVNRGYNINNLHIVGHSLGGQMVGKVGRHLKEITDGRLSIPRIFALDPAGPGFESHNVNGMEPISRTDGDYVQIIHTDGGELGMQSRVGTADFYPDGGTNHPGCEMNPSIGPSRYRCEHHRSWQYYQASVRHPKAFPAIRCLSWDEFLIDSCFKNEIAYMGFTSNTSVSGKFYLETNGNLFNLSRGQDGIKHMDLKVTRLSVPENKFAVLPVPEEIQNNVVF